MPGRRKKRPSILSVLALVALSAALVGLLAVRGIRYGSGAAEPVFAPSKPETAPAAAPVSAASEPAPTDAPPSAEPEAAPSPAPTPEPQPEYFTISMVGDCTLAEAKTRRGWGTAYQSVVGKNYAYPFANTVEYFRDDYLTIANLECVLSDRFYDSIEQFVFLAPAAYANILTEGCVDFVTLANNHTMDFGQAAYNDTAAALDSAGVLYAGEDEYAIFQGRDDGVKIGLYCLYNRLTYNSMSILSAAAQEKLVADSKEMIAAAEKKLREEGADFTVACLHMGREGYYETSDVQVDVCRYSIDSGFDLVYCTHAHRLQPAESYGKGLIFYGMGNWSFGGHTNPGNGTDPGAYDTGIAQITLCRKGDSVTLDSYRFIPCSISSTVDPETGALNANTLNNYQPTPYAENGKAWQRTMTMLNGTYEGANYTTDYGNVLSAMNG